MSMNPNEPDSNDPGKSYEDLLKESQEPSKNYSQASKSDISTPEEDSIKQKQGAVLNLVQDVQTQREDIDKINANINYLAEKLQEVLNAIQNPKQTGDKQTSGLIDLANTPLGEKLLDRLLPAENVSSALIDNKTIEERMKKTFFDNLDTGESINDFIKNSLKKSVTKNVINTSLKDIGNQTPHGP